MLLFLNVILDQFGSHLKGHLFGCVLVKRQDEDYDEQVEESLQDEVNFPSELHLHDFASGRFLNA